MHKNDKFHGDVPELNEEQLENVSGGVITYDPACPHPCQICGIGRVSVTLDDGSLVCRDCWLSQLEP